MLLRPRFSYLQGQIFHESTFIQESLGGPQKVSKQHKYICFFLKEDVNPSVHVFLYSVGACITSRFAMNKQRQIILYNANLYR